jgi:hypothetical protein
MKRRWLSVVGFLCLAGWSPAANANPPVTRQDDAYHLAFFEDGQHDGSYAEWWYFNLADPEQDLQVAFAYSVIDPRNRSGLGLASVLAMVYTPGGHFQQGAYLPPDSFSASYEQADVAVAAGDSGGGRIEVIDDTRYRILGAVAGDHRVAWNLVYERRAEPWFAADRQNVGSLPWEQMSWLLYMPGASVSGRVVVDGRTYRVRGVRGYHDHNWGEWIPSFVAWNWAQYFEAGLSFAMGDFRSAPTGVVGLDFLGERVVFEKAQYRLVHTAWQYDPANRQWFPTTSWLLAENETTAVLVRLQERATLPIVPPLDIPLLPEPLLYEQTARIAGAVWGKDPQGGWLLRASFDGGGFKEYTSVTAASPP